jgi:3-methylcrotonyl-CoA carboxylase alpha subunit
VIESVLVANRGEIAVRIFRTCQRLGIRTIGVYSDADAHALHVAEADEAYWIGPSPAGQSYLNVDALLNVARGAGAQAIHPGYGFLAENADFAQAVLDAGWVWVGPPVEAMRLLGDKARAKTLAEQHGVPVLPGYHGTDQSAEALADHAARIGYPLMIKASAGGGGRGMRVVEAPAHFAEALAAAQREARASFGDQRVLLERYVARPRHVEVQIFGDAQGNLIHLGERECSIQRRHQKLVEESPSPAVDADLRTRMGDAALRLGRAAGYTNAGTVEFLLDQNGQFAFLEVNARLQVEHPVTEAVTGLDLVELQLRVAAGEALGLAQGDIRFDGHAIEVRVIAEDVLAGFLPSSGRVERFAYPNEVRVDTWVAAGTEVSAYYDSLLAKVIAHGTDRPAAVARLGQALHTVWIDGVADNVDLLLATIEHPAFLQGELHTGFLDDHHILAELAEVPPGVMAAVSAVDFLSTPSEADPWRAHTGWRVGRVDQPAAWTRAGRLHTARVTDRLDAEGVQVDPGAQSKNAGAQPLNVRLLDSDSHDARRRLSVEGRTVTVWDDAAAGRRVVEWAHRTYRLQRPKPLSVEATAADRGARGGIGRLTAPMPGRIVKIAVTQGQQVRQNQPLVVLEAMKMEHIIEAPHAGVVTEVCVEIGQQVSSGAQLLTLGTAEDEPQVKLA